jgi:hypothetical protein
VIQPPSHGSARGEHSGEREVDGRITDGIIGRQNKRGADVAVRERTTGIKRNGDAPLGYSERTALRKEQCDVDGATLVKRPPPPAVMIPRDTAVARQQ